MVYQPLPLAMVIAHTHFTRPGRAMAFTSLHTHIQTHHACAGAAGAENFGSGLVGGRICTKKWPRCHGQLWVAGRGKQGWCRGVAGPSRNPQRPRNPAIGGLTGDLIPTHPSGSARVRGGAYPPTSTRLPPRPPTPLKTGILVVVSSNNPDKNEFQDMIKTQQ